MGACLSTTKVRSSNSNTTANAAATQKTRRKGSAKASNKNQQKRPQEGEKSPPNQPPRNPQPHKVKEKANVRRGAGAIPCGKRTDFGYAKDFDVRYTIGKLLGHGQFGYTYVATDKGNGDRVAVKRIEKSKVCFGSFPSPSSSERVLDFFLVDFFEIL